MMRLVKGVIQIVGLQDSCYAPAGSNDDLRPWFKQVCALDPSVAKNVPSEPIPRIPCSFRLFSTQCTPGRISRKNFESTESSFRSVCHPPRLFPVFIALITIADELESIKLVQRAMPALVEYVKERLALFPVPVEEDEPQTDSDS